MSEHKPNTSDDSSRNLSIMAAAVEHMSASAAAEVALNEPTRRSKLVLPTFTPEMAQDLALAKVSGSNKSSKPLSIGTRPEYVDYPLRGIVTPHPNDVLCGRGGGSNNHPGNESFRELVNEVKVPYVNCPKREKPLIARRIVEAVRHQTPPGRFLSKDNKGLWNDIGDGKAREKTSQALREGAPIIRDMIGKPSSPTNVASALKEAKKAERAEKEYGVKLPKQQRSSPDRNEDAPTASAKKAPDVNVHQESPSLPSNEPTNFKRGTSMGNHIMLNNSSPMPPLKKFRSLGERQDFVSNGGDGLPQATLSAAWPTMAQHQQQQPGRNFNMMPYTHQMMGGFAPVPSRGGRVDYANTMSARYPSADSVPMETVRRLLLGQLDPVQLALQILPPEEVAIVARYHAASNGLAVRPSPIMSSGRGPPGPITHPLLLNPMVSDGSSTSSSGDSSVMRRTPSDHTSAAQGGYDDASSVDSAKQSGTPANGKKHVLPKKKRKYIET